MRPSCSLLPVIVMCLVACGDDGGGPEPIFDVAYLEAYEVSRECERSIDHEFNYVRIYTNSLATGPYQNQSDPFPAGSTIVKEEYLDEMCTGDLVQVTVMRKEEEGVDPAVGDWLWQIADETLRVDGKYNIERCTSCHQSCVGDDGYDWTCAVR